MLQLVSWQLLAEAVSHRGGERPAGYGAAATLASISDLRRRR